MRGSGTGDIEMGYWRGGAWRRTRKPFEGVIPNLERRLRETESDFTRDRLRGYMSRMPCTGCGGARLRPEILAVTVSVIVDLKRPRRGLARIGAADQPLLDLRVRMR